MKRNIISLCLCIILVSIAGLLPSAWATDYEGIYGQVLVSETTEYLPDGSKIITSIYEEPIMPRSSLYNRKGTKIHTFADSNGNTLWRFLLLGEFRIIEGASVTCISASCSTEIYDSDWSCIRKTATPSGSWAIANGEFAMTLLGIVVSRETIEVSLTSDVYGNLS